MNELEKLEDCARLRGVDHLVHRTIHELAWFVDELIFERNENLAKKWRKAYLKKIENGVSDYKDLQILIDLFHKYCKEEYAK